MSEATSESHYPRPKRDSGPGYRGRAAAHPGYACYPCCLLRKSRPTGFGPIAIGPACICCWRFLRWNCQAVSRCSSSRHRFACPSHFPLWEGSAVARSRHRSSIARQFATSLMTFPFLVLGQHCAPNKSKEKTASLTLVEHRRCDQRTIAAGSGVRAGHCIRAVANDVTARLCSFGSRVRSSSSSALSYS
jgi:hypothetical protein